MSLHPPDSVDQPEPIALADSACAHDLHASLNHGPRKDGKRPTHLILHYTGMPAGRGMSMAERAIRWLADPRSQVSAHYVVAEDGRITQMVAEARRAWHAGRGAWAGETDLNSVSIGIEIAHAGHPWDGVFPDLPEGVEAPVHPGLLTYPEAQVEAVIALADDIVRRHGIRADRVLAHSDIAPDRKRDPGETFPWARLAAAGIGHWTEPVPIRGGRFFARGDEGQPVQALQSMLALYGYAMAVTGVYDEATEQVVCAFQRHFRPARVDGIADASTIETLYRLNAGRASEAV
jgi:N-acetylmuramoyl-L-alanine amidase